MNDKIGKTYVQVVQSIVYCTNERHTPKSYCWRRCVPAGQYKQYEMGIIDGNALQIRVTVKRVFGTSK